MRVLVDFSLIRTGRREVAAGAHGTALSRGSVWWVDLGDPIGSEPGFRRPVLIVSADAFNRSAISTVVGVVITSNTALAVAPGNVRLPKRAAGLAKASVVNVTQPVTLDRSRMVERSGAVTSAQLAEVDAGLRLALEL